MWKERTFCHSYYSEKQKTCADGQIRCTYNLTLKEEINPDTNKIQLELTQKEKSASEVSLGLKSGAAKIEGKNLSFEVEISYFGNNRTEIWSTFDMKFQCISTSSNEKSLWEQTISGFKITNFIDTEKHNIDTDTTLNNVYATTSTSTVGENDSIKINITSDRDEDVTDAKLNISVGTKYVLFNFDDNKISPGSKEYTFTKKGIQDLFTAQGQGTIGDNDEIKFTIVRPGAYEVKGVAGADHRLYQLNDWGKCSETPVADDKIPENKILIKNKWNDYVLSDLTFKQFLSSSKLGSEASIAFLKGEYYSDGACPSQNVNLTIEGIVDSQGNYLSSLRAYGDTQTGQQPEGLGLSTVAFNLSYINVKGREGNDIGLDLWQGIKCRKIEANNCHFYGAFTLSGGGHSKFNTCTFDSRNAYRVVNDNTIKNVYPMFIYSDASAEFDGCTFESIGKAIKISTDGDKIGSGEYKIQNCTFNLYEPEIEIPGQQGTKYTMDEVEFPIDINGLNLNEKIYNVQVSSITLNELWLNTDYTKKGITESKYYWVRSKVDQNNKAKNVIINGSKVDSDQTA